MQQLLQIEKSAASKVSNDKNDILPEKYQFAMDNYDFSNDKYEES